MSLTRVVISLAGILVISGIFIQRALLSTMSGSPDTSFRTEVTASLNQPPATVTLGGQVREGGVVPMQGVTVVMFENLASGPVVVATTTTGADGRYSVIVEAKCTVYEMKPFLGVPEICENPSRAFTKVLG